MGIRNTIEWAKNEWGIFAKRDEMSIGETVRWLRQWVPFGARTVGYGTISLTAGPLSPNRAVSAWAQRQWSISSMHGLAIDASVEGEQNAPTSGHGFVYAANHQSLLDILVLGGVLPRDMKWAAKRSLMNIPFLGWHLRLAGHVPVDRRAGAKAAQQTVDRFVDVLRNEGVLLVFPEGTRSPDGEIKRFKRGAFIAAVRANRPVVPVALEGTYDLMQKHQADTGQMNRDRSVRVKIGRPVAVDQGLATESERVDALRDEVERRVRDLHAELPSRRARA